MKRFSENLKRVRESKGISIQDISKETRINPKFLEAIENGNYKVLPQTYVRAFIRAFAKHLGLNPNEVLEQYNQELSGKPSIESSPKSTSQQSPQQPIQAEPRQPIEPQKTDSSENDTNNIPKTKEINLTPKIEVVLESSKSEEKTEANNKRFEFKDDSKLKEKSQKIKINLPVLIILFLLIITVGVIAIFYFPIQSPPKNEVKEQPFENVLKETMEKYNPQPKQDTLKNAISDSLKDVNNQFPADSLTLSLLSDKDTWVNIQMDNNRFDRGRLTPNQQKVVRAKEKFIIIASRGKGIKVFLNNKYLGNLSNSDSLRSVSVTPEGIKNRKIDKKPEIKKQDELKPLDYRPIG
jgi:cytoskeletal protein RodZ